MSHPEPCPTCNGDGIVQNPHSSVTAPTYVVCPDCSGSGLASSSQNNPGA